MANAATSVVQSFVDACNGIIDFPFHLGWENKKKFPRGGSRGYEKKKKGTGKKKMGCNAGDVLRAIGLGTEDVSEMFPRESVEDQTGPLEALSAGSGAETDINMDEDDDGDNNGHFLGSADVW